jgi:hypothetical protein
LARGTGILLTVHGPLTDASQARRGYTTCALSRATPIPYFSRFSELR